MTKKKIIIFIALVIILAGSFYLIQGEVKNYIYFKNIVPYSRVLLSGVVEEVDSRHIVISYTQRGKTISFPLASNVELAFSSKPIEDSVAPLVKFLTYKPSDLPVSIQDIKLRGQVTLVLRMDSAGILRVVRIFIGQ